MGWGGSTTWQHVVISCYAALICNTWGSWSSVLHCGQLKDWFPSDVILRCAHGLQAEKQNRMIESLWGEYHDKKM